MTEQEQNPEIKIIKKVDEAWKSQVERERAGVKPPPPQPAAPSAPAPGQQRDGRPPERERPAPGPREAAQTDFGFFISSLSMQAMIALGEMPHPMTNMPQEDLEQARYLIDVLGMLQEKTKGNLAPEEGQLLEGVLYELRTKYVSRLRQAGGERP